MLGICPKHKHNDHDRNSDHPRNAHFRAEDHLDIALFLDELEDGMVGESDPRWDHLENCQICGQRVRETRRLALFYAYQAKETPASVAI